MIESDETTFHPSHDAIQDADMLADAIEAMPDQEAKRYAQITDQEVVARFKNGDEEIAVPPRHLRIARFANDSTHFDVIDKRLETDDTTDKKDHKKAVIISGISAAAVITIMGAITIVRKRKSK